MTHTPAGRLQHEMTIEKITGKLQSGTGKTDPQWTESDIRFGEIKPLRGRNIEIAAARTKGRATTHQITMRYVEGDDMNPATTRIRRGQKVYEIFQALNVMEMGIEWDILANESNA